MFHVIAAPPADTRSLYTEVKRDILQRMADAGDILQFLAAKNVTVRFAQPARLSKSFNEAGDAGSLSVIGNSIFLDARKTIPQLADDLARRTRVLMTAKAPNALERVLFERAGITFGRIMTLEQRDGF